MASSEKSKGGGFGGHHGRGPVKHLGVMRGAGVLIEGGREMPADYQIDVYEGRNQKSGNGTLFGDFPASLESEETRTALLRLEGGAEVTVLILDQDDEGLDIETQGDIPGF